MNKLFSYHFHFFPENCFYLVSLFIDWVGIMPADLSIIVPPALWHFDVWACNNSRLEAWNGPSEAIFSHRT